MPLGYGPARRSIGTPAASTGASMARSQAPAQQRTAPPRAGSRRTRSGRGADASHGGAVGRRRRDGGETRQSAARDEAAPDRQHGRCGQQGQRPTPPEPSLGGSGVRTGMAARLARRSGGAPSSRRSRVRYHARRRCSRSRSVIGRFPCSAADRWRHAAASVRNGAATERSLTGCRAGSRSRRRKVAVVAQRDDDLVVWRQRGDRRGDDVAFLCTTGVIARREGDFR